MTLQEKLIEKVRSMLYDNVKKELLKKYPEASEEDIKRMMDEYLANNPSPI